MGQGAREVLLAITKKKLTQPIADTTKEIGQEKGELEEPVRNTFTPSGLLKTRSGTNSGRFLHAKSPGRVLGHIRAQSTWH